MDDETRKLMHKTIKKVGGGSEPVPASWCVLPARPNTLDLAALPLGMPPRLVGMIHPERDDTPPTHPPTHPWSTHPPTIHPPPPR
jgi:hypothetical protein